LLFTLPEKNAQKVRSFSKASSGLLTASSQKGQLECTVRWMTVPMWLLAQLESDGVAPYERVWQKFGSRMFATREFNLCLLCPLRLLLMVYSNTHTDCKIF